MKFVIYRHSQDPDHIVVTDEAHRGQLPARALPKRGDVEEIGTYPEMGAKRVAFNEAIAKDAIKNQGYYAFEAKSFDPVAQSPGAMPG